MGAGATMIFYLGGGQGSMDNSLGPLCLRILTIPLGPGLAIASLPLPGVHGIFRVPPALGRLPRTGCASPGFSEPRA